MAGVAVFYTGADTQSNEIIPPDRCDAPMMIIRHSVDSPGLSGLFGGDDDEHSLSTL